MMAFTDEQIRSIVKAGRISDPAAEQYLVETLISRRDKVGRYWLTRRSSFDSFQFEDGVLKFEHLASKYDFARKPEFTFSETDWSFATLYTVVEVCSSEGNVLVYIRNGASGPEIVGVER